MNTSRFIGLTLVSFFVMACSNKGNLPTVRTGQYTTYPATKTVQCEGYVETDGGEVVVDRGICYVVGSGNPNVGDHRVSSGSGKGSFTAVLTDINEGEYTYRAYATNSAGTAYGETRTFKMESSSSSGGGGNPGEGGQQGQENCMKAGNKTIPITKVTYEMVDRYALNPSYHCYTNLEFYNNNLVIFRVMQSSLSSITSLPIGTWYYGHTWTYDTNQYDGWYTSEYDYNNLNYYNQESLQSVKVSQSGGNYVINIVANSYASLHYEGTVQTSHRTEYAN